MLPRSGALSLVLALGSIATARAAGADDWLQFRKDGTRTGVSKDTLSFPMTDVWDWDTQDVNRQLGGSHVALWNGRAFFLASERLASFLVCADAKTGTVLWRQRLQAPGSVQSSLARQAARGIPAVSPTGKVFVYDMRSGKMVLPGPPSQRARMNPKFRSKVAQSLLEVGGFAVLVFDGTTGQPLALLPTAISVMMPEVPQVDLLHGPPRTFVPLSRIRPSRMRHEQVPFLGVPLIYGEELYATSLRGTLFRWMPGSFPTFTRIAHPPPGPFPEITIPSLLNGFPPTTAGDGIYIADDQSFRFGALVGGEDFHRWHHDLDRSIGVASSSDGFIFAGMGDLGATRGIACFDAGSGVMRWAYAPRGLPVEPQRLEKHSVEFLQLLVGDRRNATLRPNDLLELAAKLKARGYNAFSEWERIWMMQPRSIAKTGHMTNSGVVVTQGRVYAEVSGTIVALEQSTGRPVWSQPLPLGGQVQTLVAGPRHLLACYAIAKRGGSAGGHQQLVALRLDNGKIEWEQEVTKPGNLSLSDGLIYFANGDITVMGPAERTYYVASDTDEALHYAKPRPPKKEEDPNAPQFPAAEEDPAVKASVLPHAGARADASWLRLSLATPDPELAGKVRARVKLVGARGVPLGVQLDWLDATRSAIAGVAGGSWSPVAEARFVRLCRELAAEAGPAYFDVAPDVNVYLRRYPERLDAVLQLLQKAGRAVREAAPQCQVIVTLQTETLLGAYGQGLKSPFGKLPKLERKVEVDQIARLVEFADAVGLSVEPQTGFRNAGVIPRDYLLRVRLLLPQEPLLVTRIRLEADAPGLLARMEQARFIHRIRQCCYWLSARWIVQPELTGYTDEAPPADPLVAAASKPGPTSTLPVGTAPLAAVLPSEAPPAPPAPMPPAGKAGLPAANLLTPPDPIRLAARKWRQIVFWERVHRLTARPPVPEMVGVDEAEVPDVDAP